MTRGKVCPARVNRACRAMLCTPAGKLIYSNSRVHGHMTLGVVSMSSNHLNWILNKTRNPCCYLCPWSLSRWESRKDLWACCYYITHLVPCYYISLQWNTSGVNFLQGDSLDRTGGDSSGLTPDVRDSAVQLIKRDCVAGDSTAFTLDEQGASSFQGCLLVPKCTAILICIRFQVWFYIRSSLLSAARCWLLLVFVKISFFPLLWHFCSSVHWYTPFLWYMMHISIVLM